MFVFIRFISAIKNFLKKNVFLRCDIHTIVVFIVDICFVVVLPEIK